MTPGPPIRVMTVDDHPVFRNAAAAIVAAMPGFEYVGESTNGEEALQQVPVANPDVVILDVRMPGMDGIELAGRLAEQDPTRVIVLTSSEDVRSFSRLARSCGAAALVSKHWLTPRMLRGLWMVHRRR